MTVVLPDEVRRRVVAYASDALGRLPLDQIPGPLRAVARFTPSRRARHAAAEIVTLLATDEEFRDRVAERASLAAGELGNALVDGVVPAAADPVEVAALTYLLRTEGWQERLAAYVADVRGQHDQAARAGQAEEVGRLREQLETLRSQHRAEVERLREQARAARREAEEAQGQVRELRRTARAAQAEAEKATAAASTERGRITALRSETDAELRRLRSRLTEVEEALRSARQATREERSVDEARLWLLLETISQAARGLQRELAISAPSTLPADAVANEQQLVSGGAVGEPAARGLASDDPAWLDQLLALPTAHLIVDGYNVTKTGFAQLSLERQRGRLIASMGTLAAQTGAETTIVFDGNGVAAPTGPLPRRVRVLFSPAGVTADEVIRRLARAEPPGRPVIAASSDREVADGVRQAGGYAVSAALLIRRMQRA
ncbi:NYN domain-containing protein [Fodinicola acaciae]|uniref:NYN domain-containing protein n=1 Tax=Fodinicola acaciae TaxID=2681555 RepID=UPI0013D4D9DD|nr:NYN domain-containing protein [Fodinicola acaciae]